MSKDLKKQKDKILVAAAKLFRKKSYMNTTIEDIANQLKINKATIYYYYKDKSSILFEVMSLAINGYIERAKQVISEDIPIPEKMKTLVKLHVSYEITPTSTAGIAPWELRNLPPKLSKLYIAQRDAYEHLFCKIIHDGISQGFFNKQNYPAITARFILGLVNSITIWFRKNGPLSPDEVGDEVWKFIYLAIRKKNRDI